jgi:hypothetical protein
MAKNGLEKPMYAAKRGGRFVDCHPLGPETQTAFTANRKLSQVDGFFNQLRLVVSGYRFATVVAYKDLSGLQGIRGNG